MNDLSKYEAKAKAEVDLSILEPQLKELSRAIKATFISLIKMNFAGSVRTIDYLEKSINFISTRHSYKHTEGINKNINEFIEALIAVRINEKALPLFEVLKSQTKEIIAKHNEYIDLCVTAERSGFRVIPDLPNSSRGYYEFKAVLDIIDKDAEEKAAKKKQFDDKNVIHKVSLHCFKNKHFYTASVDYGTYKQTDLKTSKWDSPIVKLQSTDNKDFSLYIKPEGIEIKETIEIDGKKNYVSKGFIPFEALENIESYFKNLGGRND